MRADRAVTVVVDLYPHDVVYGGGPDVHRRADRLSGVSDAVGDQLRDEQTNVLPELGMRATLSQRETALRARTAPGATRHRRLADLHEGCRLIWGHLRPPWDSRTPSLRTARRALR